MSVGTVAGLPASSSVQLAQMYQGGVRTPGDAARLSRSPRVRYSVWKHDVRAFRQRVAVLGEFCRNTHDPMPVRAAPGVSSCILPIPPFRPNTRTTRLPDVECAGSGCYRHTDTGRFRE